MTTVNKPHESLDCKCATCETWRNDQLHYVHRRCRLATGDLPKIKLGVFRPGGVPLWALRPDGIVEFPIGDFGEFIRVVENEAARYGRAALRAVEDPNSLLIGFESPKGKFWIGIYDIRDAFPGMQDDVITRLYRERVAAALDRGEKRGQ